MVMQPLQPPDTVAAVTTGAWALVHYVGVGTIAPLALSLLLPHDFIRLSELPMGLAVALLGYTLWSAGREKGSEALHRQSSAQVRATPAA